MKKMKKGKVNNTFEGFAIYKSGTCRILSPIEVAKMSRPKDEYLSLAAVEFILDDNGSLRIVTLNNEVCLIPKEGKYDIHFDGIAKMRY